MSLIRIGGMFDLKTDVTEIAAELGDVVRLFTNEYDPELYEVVFLFHTAAMTARINGTDFFFQKPRIEMQNKLIYRKYFARACKNALYRALVSFFGRETPWGSLTGIRPTKLAYELLSAGDSLEAVSGKLQSEFFVSSKKARLVTDIVQNQRGYLTRDPSLVNLYVHVPFCPSRCYYCSFVTSAVDRQKNFVAPYVDKLCAEIHAARRMIRAAGKRIDSVYIGGGTPTVLSDAQFESLLRAVGINGDPKSPPPEFTCEAGRPETITPEKIGLMKRYGVTRVSVTPQSLSDETLRAIGRSHTAQDFYAAYDRVKNAGFTVNVDLIAGLARETPEDFSRTLKGVAGLRPHNITVHTLSRKRGSFIKETDVKSFTGGVSLMTDFAAGFLTADGYVPYYLYRQKLMLENLENVGYRLQGFHCVNNITVMEEALSVVACGAGAISKRIIPDENRIERLANIKDVKLYLERFDERLAEKEKFFA